MISDGTVGADSGATQIVGALVLAIVMFGIAYGFFRVQDALTKGGIRRTEEDELVGLDLPEMGVLGLSRLPGTRRCPVNGWRSGPGPGAGRGRLSRGNHVNDTSEGPALSGAGSSALSGLQSEPVWSSLRARGVFNPRRAVGTKGWGWDPCQGRQPCAYP